MSDGEQIYLFLFVAQQSGAMGAVLDAENPTGAM